MKQATRTRLNGLNRVFYDAHAEAFSNTRSRPWRGFARVLDHVHEVEGRLPRVLDVGCGNGRLLTALDEKFPAGFEYTGIDASEALLSIARTRHRGTHVRFVCADFVERAPELALPAGEHDFVALFGVLHHVPSEASRRALVHASCRRLARGGVLALTLWRFDRDPRFAQRRIPLEGWCTALCEPAITAGELDPGDQLLRFGPNGDAVRYCHFTDDAELSRLLLGQALSHVDRFRADGASDDLNDYVLLSRETDDRGLETDPMATKPAKIRP
jgi:tRNA (uracil-5-)-methyltransferase TRM9